MKIDPAAVVSTASTPTGSTGANSASAAASAAAAEQDTIEGLTARLLLLQAKAASSGDPASATIEMNKPFRLGVPPPPPPPASASSGAASSAAPPPPPGPPTSWVAPPKGSVAQLVLEQTKGDGFVVTEEKLVNYKPTVDRPDSGRPVQCKACARWCKQWRFMLQLLIYTTADWTEKAQTEQDN